MPTTPASTATAAPPSIARAGVRAWCRTASGGPISTASTSRAPRPWTATATAAASSTSRTSRSTAGPKADRRGAAGVEGHRRERAVQGHQGGAAEHEQGRGRDQVAVGDPERIAEEQLLEPLRRVRRQREQRAEPDQAGDRHGGAGVRADARVARRERDQRGGHQRPAGGAEQERSAGERREHQAGQEAVRERLGAVGEALGHDPEAERATERSHQGELEQRAPVDAGAQGVDEEVDHLHVSARARGAGR